MKQKGFILISMLFMMVLLAVTAITLNRRAALQARMAANQISSIQTALGQSAVTEQSIWELTKDPFWRTSYLDPCWDPTAPIENYTPENYIYPTANGTTYNRWVLNRCPIGGEYEDAVMVMVKVPGARKIMTTAFRYYLVDFLALVSPYHVFCDAWDNIYLADYSNHSVIKVDSQTGAMTRVAGTGTSCDPDINPDCGDGGPATSAWLDTPTGVWVDASGLIYIADRNSHRIRRVDLAGTITTVAGGDDSDFSGDDSDFSGDGGPATSAELNYPTGIYGDAAGNLYIADTYNHRVRKVDTSGNIDTVAGDGDWWSLGDTGPAVDAGLYYPRGVYVEADGSVLYIADTDNHRIRKVNLSTDEKIYTIAGDGNQDYLGDGGLATDASLSVPRSVVKDSAGNFYIGDYGNHAIRRFSDGGTISTVAGDGTAGYSGDGGPATSAQIDSPAGVCLTSAENLIIADTMNSCLREVAAGNISTLTAKGDPGFNSPEHITMDSSGNVYIADKNNHRIRKLDTAGKVTTVAGTGSTGWTGDGGAATSAKLDTPEGVFVDGSGNIYIADTVNCRIRKVDTADPAMIWRVAGKGGSPKCTYSGDGDLATSAELKKPRGVFVDASDNLYIADTDNHRIRKVNGSTQIISTVAGTGTGGFSGDGGAATSARLDKPNGVFLDSTNNIYIADTNNHCIRKVNTSGNISTVAGIGTQPGYSGDGGVATSAELRKPNAVFVDSAGNIFIADQDNHVIRVVSVHDNKIYTLAGTGTAGYDGGDQPAVDVRLDKPGGITMAATRGGMKIYLSDRDNNRIRTLRFRIAKKLY